MTKDEGCEISLSGRRESWFRVAIYWLRLEFDNRARAERKRTKGEGNFPGPFRGISAEGVCVRPVCRFERSGPVFPFWDANVERV